MPQARSTASAALSAAQPDWTIVFHWVRLGWRDLWTRPVPSLIYGGLVFLVSWTVVASLFSFDLSAYLFPALAGFFIIGPILALGLYDKSRRIENGEAVSLSTMLLVRAKSTTQILFSGVLLCLLILLWMRAAVILYALFFGLRPFSGFEQTLPFVFGTLEGWALFIVGSAVGGLFAAFAFAAAVPFMAAGSSGARASALASASGPTRCANAAAQGRLGEPHGLSDTKFMWIHSVGSCLVALSSTWRVGRRITPPPLRLLRLWRRANFGGYFFSLCGRLIGSRGSFVVGLILALSTLCGGPFFKRHEIFPS